METTVHICFKVLFKGNKIKNLFLCYSLVLLQHSNHLQFSFVGFLFWWGGVLSKAKLFEIEKCEDTENCKAKQ